MLALKTRTMHALPLSALALSLALAGALCSPEPKAGETIVKKLPELTENFVQGGLEAQRPS